MSSLNKAIILGRVGQKPEGKTLDSGAKLVTFSLATHEAWKDKQGNKQEDLQWHNITVWGKQAENVYKYVDKGDLLYVEGKLQTDQYEKDGEKRYSTKIVAREVKFLTPKQDKRPPGNDMKQHQPAPHQPHQTKDISDVPW